MMECGLIVASLCINNIFSMMVVVQLLLLLLREDEKAGAEKGSPNESQDNRCDIIFLI